MDVLLTLNLLITPEAKYFSLLFVRNCSNEAKHFAHDFREFPAPQNQKSLVGKSF